MIFKDYYKILGFDTNKVTIEQIRTAYREKAKEYHPDRNINTNESEEIFKDINEAYRTLSNDKLRRKYDFSWYRYVALKNKKKKSNEKEKKTIGQMLAEIFLGKGSVKKMKKESKRPVYGENIITKIDVTIDEAYKGAIKKLKLRTVQGKESVFQIKIPAGIQNNDRLRIAGQGKKGKNGGRNGDLFVYVNIKNSKKIRLSGTNIFYELPLEVWEAALGTNKTINLFGEKIRVIVPKATSSGERFIIKGKGYKDGNGARGDLFVMTKIVLPNKITKEQYKIYESLRKTERPA